MAVVAVITDPLGLDDFLSTLKGADELPKVKRELAAALTRAATAEAKIRDVLDLLADPGESHRMLTRKEIGRLLR